MTSSEEMLQAFARDVELMLSTLPATSADALVENPHRELEPAEVELLDAMSHMLDSERDNRYLLAEYADFIQLAVSIDESARVAQDRAQAVLEVLPEEDGVSLVLQPFQPLTPIQVEAIQAIGDETLLRANAEGHQLAEDIAVFLDQNVTVAEDEDEA